MSKKAVHFGAGNIGRGFVGQFLHASGYEVVFADVDPDVVQALRRQSSYEVHEVSGQRGTATDHVTTVSGYRSVDNRLEVDDVVRELATADVVTTSVGPRILPSLAATIGRGLAERAADRPPVVIVACETAINASGTLAGFVRQVVDDDDAFSRAVFANCEIDRIVPEQSPGLDVTIESFAEWIIETGPFSGRAAAPEIAGVTWVDDLAPFIDRKLFTVNTAHATAAYYGWARGIGSVRDALAEPAVHAEVLAVLAETKALLVAKYGVDPDEQQAYIEKNLQRISNPHLPDTTGRVGRNPLSKLSRHERLVGPAAQLAERGLPADALVRAVRAALDFNVPDDVESRELQSLLRAGAGDELLTETLTGVFPGHPLFPALVAVIGDKVRSCRVAA
ncbi:mannitol-1-phosphate 5-dehydrogenase [Frondihabitans sucicola]|uniref:Mannitol-1-phosphate 5-dehydrogenase n=1 Tax=Frondihabitans sucicola TaxID=1268041 RepID=A0ABN6Y6R1_9MICO|nr:mannitol-1-phosphate 5-dehydrogenase [Frondihabitans sucicola]